MKKLKLPDFTNKCVSVSLANQDYGRIVANPHWEMQGDRLILVGTVPPDACDANWCAGLTAALAWDQASEYVVFNSVEHYRKRIAIYERSKKKAKRV